MTITKKYKDHIVYKNELGELHREDGPAQEYISGPYKGLKYWCINDKLHRLDGPAEEFSDGTKYWYFQGKHINCKTQEEFERLIKLMVLW